MLIDMNQLVAFLSNNYEFYMSRSRKEGEFTKTEEKGFIMEEIDQIETYLFVRFPLTFIFTMKKRVSQRDYIKITCLFMLTIKKLLFY